MKIGIAVNKKAGMGGMIGHKGTDNLSYQQAIALGSAPRAIPRTERFLSHLNELMGSLPQAKLTSTQSTFITTDPEIAALFTEYNLPFEIAYPGSEPVNNSSNDTLTAVERFNNSDIDLLVFAGGDGTARDIIDHIEPSLPVIGIPCGVKMHSGCFAVSPEAASELLIELITGKLVSVRFEEVRDIDEEAVNAGRVTSRYYGDVLVPDSLQYMQHTKLSGQEHEPLVLQEIADYLCELMEPGSCYFFGPGTTTRAVFENLGIASEKTLLGVDCVIDGKLARADCGSAELEEFADNQKCYIVISPTGKQGQLIGRGNQQFSPKLLSTVGKEQIIVLSPKAKLLELQHRPLLIDTNDRHLDQHLSGFYTVICGYNERVLYPASWHYQ